MDQPDRQDARIIVGLFYDETATRVFCEVYRNDLYGKKYVWFILGWYENDWYTKTVEDLEHRLKEAHMEIGTRQSFVSDPTDAVKNLKISNECVAKLKTLLRVRIENPRMKLGLMHLVTISKVISQVPFTAQYKLAQQQGSLRNCSPSNKTEKRLQKRNDSLKNFTYQRRDIMREIYAAMNSTSFIGVSGNVTFSQAGDRIALTQLEQMINGTYVGTIAIHEHSFNIYFRKRRYIRMSAPNLNNISMVGICICLFSIVLLGLDNRLLYQHQNGFTFVCKMRAWLLTIGFTLAYGAMFAKVWTVHRLATKAKKDAKKAIGKLIQSCHRRLLHISPELETSALNNEFSYEDLGGWRLYVVIVVLLAIDVIMLGAWELKDPLGRVMAQFPKEDVMTDEDKSLLPMLEHCKSRNHEIWLGVMYAYKGLVLIFGIFLAYETRSLKIKQMNDSRFVGMSIYNVVVLCLITSPVTMIIDDQQNASFTFVSLAIIFCSFLTMALIFIPKFMTLWRYPREGSESTALTDNFPSKEEEERLQKLTAENEEIKKQIAEKEEKIRSLNAALQERSRLRAAITAKQAGAAITGAAVALAAPSHAGTGTPPSEPASQETIAEQDEYTFTIDCDPAICPMATPESSFIVDPNSDSGIHSASNAKSSKGSAAAIPNALPQRHQAAGAAPNAFQYTIAVDVACGAPAAGGAPACSFAASSDSGVHGCSTGKNRSGSAGGGEQGKEVPPSPPLPPPLAAGDALPT
ncbi:PREDICTED: gamma-aminobutyric acid type B receptor subunit 1-like [Priapulus caudatus]|uniref:Gamma-aminobutyric acid type B receptor subunit 1-like n=1 Tax=Priapulus caudatus TaxID=37621 RepID=A0ABM1DQW2_PRICU|nr:PREDICTED: gamma-aminobutyric acid type B receptor subunit 1-like [Priapulus caudatus]